MITHGILTGFVCVSCLCMAVALSDFEAFAMADVICLMGYLRALRCVISLFSLFVSRFV